MKRPYTWCKHEIEKCVVVEKDNDNKGKLFACCSQNCGFWELVVKEETRGESSRNSATVFNTVMDTGPHVPI